MQAEEINVPQLLRQARKAVAQENFSEAEKLYAFILQDPEMEELLDIKTRYAFCVEKSGDIFKAIALYQDIVHIYQDSGEGGAAKALVLKINILTEREKNEPIFPPILESATTGGKKQSTTFDDILPVDEMDFLSLGTSDLSHFDEETVTQDLSNIVDAQAADSAEEITCVDVVLTAIIEHTPEPLPRDMQTVDLTEEIESFKMAENKPASQGDESFHILKNMIREGIHENVAAKGDEPDVKVSFTNIGNHELALSEHQDTDLDSDAPLMKEGVKKTAVQLFGDSGLQNSGVHGEFEDRK